ncbi:Protein of unknown function [Salinihabitans flavidus]|uniref:DUF1499 domain-containing protein n=1 Tax=Salinihabitans flavidus TaxID=569882 RepID=A0A1H8RQC4_9RHOB|nr:DUF1499 domain-containing protein [Salinihabitans flavidus]SEO68556.1 Protein of unknown function [Salinihabitans flavidus]
MAVIWILGFAILGAVAFVRFAPTDPARWHQAPQVDADRTYERGALRRVSAGPGALRRFDAIAQSDPRTTVLTGTVSEGMVTYVTRTRVVGFPDYTTAMQDGDDLLIHGRARFGRNDMGVNAERVDRWISRLEG